MTARSHARTAAAERFSGKLLIGLTYVAVGALSVGVVGLAVAGISPLADGPAFDVGTLLDRLASLDPAGLLWLGLIVVIATPVGRVIVAGVAFAAEADWWMVGVSVAILTIIALGIATALTVTV
jgi:uncharacterized membrane protein